MEQTSEERREVAARLRGLDAEITSRDTLGQAVDKFMKAVYGERPFSPVRYSVRNICGLGCVLADLIDPTCEVEGSGPLYMGDETEFLLSCGHVADMVTDCPPAFCPKCGARVVDDADGEAE